MYRTIVADEPFMTTTYSEDPGNKSVTSDKFTLTFQQNHRGDSPIVKLVISGRFELTAFFEGINKIRDELGDRRDRDQIPFCLLGIA